MSLPTSPGWHTPQDMKEAHTRTILIEVGANGGDGETFRDEDIQNLLDDTVDGSEIPNNHLRMYQNPW